YYNDLLKEELPRLFQLEAEFIRPLFQSFYYMQLNVFYTLHEKMQSMNISYFDLETDIEEGYQQKKGSVQEEAEALTIVHFKTTGNRALHQRFQKRMGKDKEAEAERERRAGPSSFGRTTYDGAPPPPYSASQNDTKLSPTVPFSSRPQVKPSGTNSSSGTSVGGRPPAYTNGVN